MSRLAIDLRILHYARTGFFRYAQGLLEAVASCPPQGEVVLLRLPDQDLGGLDTGGCEEVIAPVPLFEKSEAEGLRKVVSAHALDAIHFPSSLFPGRVAPRVMLTVHDLTVLRYPQTMQERYRPFYERAVRRAPLADRVLTDSPSIASELRDRVAARLEPEVVVPFTPFEGHGIARVDPDASTPMPSSPFVLAVGALEPRKDPLRLLAVWEAARSSLDRPLPLVIVASHGWLEEEFHAAVARCRWPGEVQLRRNIDDPGLVRLLQNCAVFLAMSRYEGFGLPVLEAAHAGACVMSTPVPSLVDAGVDGELFIDPEAATEKLGARLAELVADADRRGQTASRIRATLQRHYAGVPRDRIARAYDHLLLAETARDGAP